MALFGGSALVRELFLPVPAPDAFRALETYLSGREAVGKGWVLKSADDFTLSVSFSTGITAMTYGMNGSAQVVPADGGTKLTVSITPRMGGQARNGANQQRISDELFAGVSDLLRPKPAEGVDVDGG